jgi:hypothetical protein
MKRLCGAVLLLLVASATGVAQSGFHLFPHFATGAGITSEFVVSNLTPERNYCDINFRADDGGLLQSIPNLIHLALPAYGSVTYTSSAAGALVSGWATVDCGITAIAATLKFTIPGVGSAAVASYSPDDSLSFSPTHGVLIPVIRDAHGLNTGLAVFSWGDGVFGEGLNSIRLTLRDSDGIQIGSPVVIKLADFTHTAKFITEFFPDGPWAHSPRFEGTVAIEGIFRIAVQALRMRLAGNEGPPEFVTLSGGPLCGRISC